jgi:hypothetical protein
MTKPTEPVAPEALDRESAARLLDCSVMTFDTHIRPLVPFVEIATPGAKRPLLRWMRRDLLAFMEARRKAA